MLHGLLDLRGSANGSGLVARREFMNSLPAVTRKRDIKQFRQACREVGLTAQEHNEASQALRDAWGSRQGERAHHGPRRPVQKARKNRKTPG